MFEKIICLVWMPAYCEISENELADDAARRGCDLRQKDPACLRTTVRAYLKGVAEKCGCMIGVNGA